MQAAAAAAKSLQSCATLCDPIDGSPSGSPSLGFSRQEHWSGLPFPSPMHESEKWKWSHSVVSYSQRPYGLQPTRLLHPWDFPGESTGVGCHCLLRTMQDPWVQFLGREDPLEEKMATHSSILAWKISWTKEPGRLIESQRVGHDWATDHHHHLVIVCLVSVTSCWIVFQQLLNVLFHIPMGNVCVISVSLHACQHVVLLLLFILVLLGGDIPLWQYPTCFREYVFTSLVYLCRDGISGSYGHSGLRIC